MLFSPPGRSVRAFSNSQTFGILSLYGVSAEDDGLYRRVWMVQRSKNSPGIIRASSFRDSPRTVTPQ